MDISSLRTGPKQMQERHGKRGLPEYQIWLTMKQRCHNPKNKRYPLYGARGITVCQEWRKSFQAFLDYLGPRPSKSLQLDRIDNNKGYEPGNVRWATQVQQVRNRRNNKRYSFQGKNLLIVEWAEETGIPLAVLRSRILVYQWTVERALTTPPGSPRKTSRMLKYNGEAKPMVQWAKDLGLDYKKLKSRIRHNWPVEKALSEPTAPCRSMSS